MPDTSSMAIWLDWCHGGGMRNDSSILVVWFVSDDCRNKSVDVIVAIQPVISDGRLAPVLAQDWEHSVVMWATPEQQTGEMISGNSLVRVLPFWTKIWFQFQKFNKKQLPTLFFFFQVGTHLMCANLKQLGFPVQFVYGNLDWQLAENQLLGGIWTSFATRYLKKAKVGLIGYQAPGFQVRSKR